MAQKYLVQCKYCGRILLKARHTVITVLEIEIKCPNPKCKILLKMPDGVVITRLKEKRAGLEEITPSGTKELT